MSKNTAPVNATGLPIQTRRKALASLAGLGAALALPKAAQAATASRPDAIGRLREEARQIMAELNAPGAQHSDIEANVLMDRAGEVELRACVEPIMTDAEAATALDWALEEVETALVDGDRTDGFVPSMLGNVLAYMTAKGGAA